MKVRVPHRWDLTPAEAIALQRQLRGRVLSEDRIGEVRYVAGVDVGYEDALHIARAAVAVLGFPTLELVDWAVARAPVRFPYVPGLLSFRETPAVLQAFARLRIDPDLVLYDGQGVAHPRRFGIACHVGVLLDVPTIGVAKTRLIGEQPRDPRRKGEWVPLTDRDEVIGAVLCTRDAVKPLYVSVGHRVSLATAVRYVLACVSRYRLPETTRWADRLASGATPSSRNASARSR